MVDAAERIIVALDVADRQEALALMGELPDLRFVKVGMELFYKTGPAFVEQLKKQGLKVFLDLKIHDIPNTAAGALRSLGSLGVDLLTVHCSGGLKMLQSAQKAAGHRVRLVGVTLLTSVDQKILNEELAISGSVGEIALRYACLAKEAGLAGVVCSPWEARTIKESCGRDFLAITPGIRFSGSDLGDQKRSMGPAEAVKEGSDYLVVGRPVLQAAQPHAAFQLIRKEMEATR